MAEYGWLTFLAGEKPWLPRGVLEQVVFQAIELPLPDVPLREAAWRQALGSRFRAPTQLGPGSSPTSFA